MKKLLAALLALGTLSAHAGVIYRWQDLTPGATLGSVSGVIEISYSQWSPDAAFVWVGSSNARPPGLERATVGGDRFAASLWPSINDAFAMADISVTLGSLLTGAMTILDGDASVRMSSVGNVWTITSYRTDMQACDNGQCSGGTGQWVLDLESLRLPEPGTWALVFVGFAAARATRKGRSAVRPPDGQPSRIRSTAHVGSALIAGRS